MYSYCTEICSAGLTVRRVCVPQCTVDETIRIVDVLLYTGSSIEKYSYWTALHIFDGVVSTVMSLLIGNGFLPSFSLSVFTLPGVPNDISKRHIPRGHCHASCF